LIIYSVIYAALMFIPPSTSVQSSHEWFTARAKRVVSLVSYNKIPDFDFKCGMQYTSVVTAKLASGIDIEKINRTILDPGMRPYSKTGSDFQRLGGFCRRKGDYDFALRGLVAMTGYFWDKPGILWPETRRKIISRLLVERGSKPKTRFKLGPGGICGTHPETENHILMIESSRHLTNQYIMREVRETGQTDICGKRGCKQFDNSRNGHAEWLLRHLSVFLSHDFSEYNSRPYQSYTVMPLQNLYEFSSDIRVKTAALNTLDYLAGKFAVSSSGLRRSVPFRRKPAFRHRLDLMEADTEAHRFLLMTGNYGLFVSGRGRAAANIPYWGLGASKMVFPALGSYRVPDLIQDVIIKKDRPYFQRFKHTGIELYYGSPSFLISAGGVFVKKWGWFTNENHGWAVPTTIMPARGGLDRSELISISGHINPNKRNNACVAPGFACGLNPVVPASIPEECIERDGPWTFVDFSGGRCPHKYDFFVAVYSAGCTSRSCRLGGGRFGFIEAAEPSAEMDFRIFKNRVLAANGGRDFGSDRVNIYVTSSGLPIEFVPNVKSLREWGIKSIAFKKTTTDMRKWKLATGDIMNSAAPGVVWFDNCAIRKRLVLDSSNPYWPRHFEQSLPMDTVGCRAFNDTERQGLWAR